MNRGGDVNIRYKFNLSLLVDDENTGEVIRNLRADIYLDADECSIDYIKSSIVSACNETIHVLNDIEH